jgi:glycosyltransferase involved in cell wall biosynthesis
MYDVVIYAPWAAPLLAGEASSGGAERQMLLLARAMAERGLHVCLVVFAANRGLSGFAGDVDLAVQPPPRRVGSRPVHALSYISMLGRTIKRLRPRVVVQRSAGPTTGVLALFARAMRTRFVYSSASIADFQFARVEPRREKVWSFHFGVRLAHVIVVQTEEQAALCRRRFRRQPVVIKSIAELSEARAERPEAFMWIGRFAAYKRPEVFVDLARRVPEASFRMVGMANTREEARLKQRIAVAARDLPNLTLLPGLRRREVAEQLASAVAVVNTSDFEGMSNVFLEGWSRGVPALSFRHDPDGVITGAGLGGFAHGSPARLADIARSMWNSRSDRSDLARVCRDYVRREHSADVVVPRWIEALGLKRP